MQKLLKLFQVAEQLNVCKSQVYNLVKQGYLPKPIKIGKREIGRAHVWTPVTL